MRAFLALFLFTTGLTVAAPAAAQTGSWSHLFGPVTDSYPPWAVEAPGGAEALYGLGFDVFSEHQESLKVTFNEQRIASGDLNEIVRTDPGLLNRKFNLRWDLTGTGVQPAITLPLPRTLGIYPTLVFQAAVADVGLDFHDHNRPEDSSSLKGRGPLFGTGLDLTRSLCRSCPWFAGASYFFQKIPSVSVDRSPAFAPVGFEVLEDRVLLDRDVQVISTRIGYGFSGNRAVSYVGALHRWNDVRIDDRLRYRDAFQTETALSSRTRLESEVTLALAGVEARLGPRLFGRLEASVGGGDRGGLFRLVYLPGRPPAPPGTLSKEEYARIASRLQEIRTELAAALDNLGATMPLAALLELLDHFEKEVLDTLPGPKYEPLRDWVTDKFQQIRDSLKQGNSAAPPSPHAVLAVFAPRRSPRIEPAALASKEVGTKAAFKFLKDLIDKLFTLADNKDLTVDLCIKTEPVRGATIEIYSLGSKKKVGNTFKSNGHQEFIRGLYGYQVTMTGYYTIECPTPESTNCRWDLVAFGRQFFRCTLSTSKDTSLTCWIEDKPSGPWDCKAP